MSVFGVFLVCIQSEYGKIWTRKTRNKGTFRAVPVSHFGPGYPEDAGFEFDKKKQNEAKVKNQKNKQNCVQKLSGKFL